MKTIITLFTTFILLSCVNAQTTAIPDANFEGALINLGFDNVIDGVVLTANIDTVTSLDVSYKLITNLTGIQDFAALQTLNCYYNQLTSLDVTQNNALIELDCTYNQLTSLDVTQNTALTYLFCDYNQLSSLDVTQNTALSYLFCAANQLTSLDVSQNIQLINLADSFNLISEHDFSNNVNLTWYGGASNPLTCLNLKNGNNIIITSVTVSSNLLSCIEVDDVAYSTTNWTGGNFYFDPASYFSTNCGNACSTTSIEENSLSNLSIYPNPTTGTITIDLGEVKQGLKATLTNSIGQVVLTKSYASTNCINFDVDYPKGLYFLTLETQGEVITKKIVKE